MNYSQLQQLETLLDALERDLKAQREYRDLATLNFMREIVSKQYRKAVIAEKNANNSIIRLMGEL